MTQFLARTLAPLLCILALVSPQALAAPVEWMVDIVVPEGGTVTGTYVYDADLDIYSDINVSAVGVPFPPSSASLTAYLALFSGPLDVDLVPGVPDLTGLQDVFFRLDAPMTNAGGVIDVVIVATYECLNAACDAFNFLYEVVDNGGSLGTITSVVPLPAAAWLFGSAVMVLVGLGRRKG